MGVIAMFASILILMLLPFYYSNKIRNAQYRPLFRFFIWLFVAVFLNLIWIGGNPVEYPYVFLGQLLTIAYFIFFLVILPILPYIELKLLTTVIPSKVSCTSYGIIKNSGF
jgi:ubiquinol-cytochrome c reductase cytochrome b/c1 subunit